MSSSTPLIQQLSNGQQNPDVTLNAVNNSQSPASLYGYNPFTSTGLTWGYYGGYFNSNAIANSTIVLTASTTNYIVAAKTNGAVTTATNTTNWDNRAQYIRLYSVVTGTSSVTSYTDFRETYSETILPAINTQTGTSYTPTLSDANGYIRMNNAAANTVTIPPNSSVAYPIGTSLSIRQVGAGATSLIAGSGVVINNLSVSLQLRKQNSTVQVLKVGTNEWDLFGDITEV